MSTWLACLCELELAAPWNSHPPLLQVKAMCFMANHLEASLGLSIWSI